MKVFLSLPMHGLMDKEIKEELAKMRKAVKSIYSTVKTIEFATNFYFTPDKDVQHVRPYCLGEAIKAMADCNLVVFHPNYRQANGCYIEYEVCSRYHMNAYVLNEEEMNS